MIEKEVRSRPGAARYLVLGVLLVLVVAGATTAAQFDGYYQVHYNGQFTFTRILYNGPGFRGFGGGPSWSHDYPDADRNMQLILDEFTYPLHYGWVPVAEVLTALNQRPPSQR